MSSVIVLECMIYSNKLLHVAITSFVTTHNALTQHHCEQSALTNRIVTQYQI